MAKYIPNLLLGAITLICYSCTDKAKMSTPVDASFSYDIKNLQVSFTAASGNGISVSQWDFGDGSRDTGVNVAHTYAYPGSYSVLHTLIEGKDTYQHEQAIILKERIVEITTRLGIMYVYLYNQTPIHRDNFLKLIESKFFDTFTFNRVVPSFVVQGGEPDGGTKYPSENLGYPTSQEYHSELTHVYGAVGAGSRGFKEASTGGQLYIVVKEAGLPQLDSNFTVFGHIIKGMDIAEKMEKEPRNTKDEPRTNIPLQIRILEKTKEEVMNEYGYTIK